MKAKTKSILITILTVICLSLFMIAGCAGGAKISIATPKSLTADFGTVYTLPDVTASYGDKTVFATPNVTDSKGADVALSNGAFFVADVNGYAVTFTAEFGEQTKTSESIAISVSLDKTAPQLSMPVQREYKVKLGGTFTLPQVSVYDAYDETFGKETNVNVKVYRGENEIELGDNQTFTVEETGVYEVVYSAENSLGKKALQSLMVYGDGRYDNLYADFEGEYAGIDVACFTTGAREAIYTPASLNTDAKYTHNASGGSLKVAKQAGARYVTLYYAPNLTHTDGADLKFTFWMYLDKIKTDTNLQYLRLKLTSQNAADEFTAVNIYALGSLADKGRTWLPCSFTVKSGQSGPFSIELFHGGVNDIGMIDFDVYFDDFAVAPIAKNTTSAYKLNLAEGETKADFDLSFIKSSVSLVDGEDYEVKAYELNTGAEVEIKNCLLTIAEGSPVVLKYMKEGVQALETSTIYAMTPNGATSGADTIAWDDDSMLTRVSGGERLSKTDLPDGVSLPDGIESVYKLYKQTGNSTKPSLKFISNGDNFIYPLTKLTFSVYVSKNLWVPNLGTEEVPDLQSCPFGFDGFASEAGKGLPLVRAYRRDNGKAVGRTYMSGAFYLNCKDLQGVWVDVEIDFSTALFTDLSGLGVWFNNYHDPAHVAENDPVGFDSYVLLTDIQVKYDNQSPVIETSGLTELDGALQSYDYNLPETSITDNVSDSSNIQIYSLLTWKDVALPIGENGAFAAKYAGEYVWKIVAVDEYGNCAIKTQSFTIEQNKAILSNGNWGEQEIFAGYEFEPLDAVAYNAEGENIADLISWSIYDTGMQEKANSASGNKVTLAEAGEYTITYRGEGLEEKSYLFTVKNGIVWNNETIKTMVEGCDDYGANDSARLPAQLSVEEVDGRNALKVQYNQALFAEENVAAAKRSFPGVRFLSNAGYTVTQNTVITFRVRLSNNFAHNTSNCGVFLIYDGVSSEKVNDVTGLNQFAKISSQGTFASSGSNASDWAVRYVQGNRVKGYNIFANAGGQNWVDVTIAFSGISNPTLSGLKILFNTSHDTTNGSSVYSKYVNDQNSWFYISDVTFTEKV